MDDASATGPHPVLDADALGRLRQLDPGGRTGLLARVFRTYAGSLARMATEVEAARRADDLAALRRLAHTLKSSSASVGAMQLSGLCADIERRIGSQSREGLSSLLDQLQAEARRVGAAVAGLLGDD